MDNTSDSRTLLHDHLSTLMIDPIELHESALQSVTNPSQGYDERFGKSAIRAYRSFFKQQLDNKNEFQLAGAASQCARQVEFLIKRHKSAQADWVRHLDDSKKERTVFPLILVLDNVRSAANVGSLFRTSDAAGCSMVITTGITPNPGGGGSEKVAKSALGAERTIDHLHFVTMTEAMTYLRTNKSDHMIVGLETTEDSRNYTSFSYPKQGCALVLGNEVTGVDTEIIPLLDAVLEIPMFGAKNSLNVAACAPIVLYEILRQWDTMK